MVLTKGIVGTVVSDRYALQCRLGFYFDTIQRLSSAGGLRFTLRPFGFETCQKCTTSLCEKNVNSKKIGCSVYQLLVLHEQHSQKVS